jgi:hypothetical protein
MNFYLKAALVTLAVIVVVFRVSSIQQIVVASNAPVVGS